MQHALFQIAHYLLTILFWIILIQVILSWLFAFNVLNTSSAGVRAIANTLDRITAPLYRPIRKVMPDLADSISRRSSIILIQIAHMLLNGAENSLTTTTCSP